MGSRQLFAGVADRNRRSIFQYARFVFVLEISVMKRSASASWIGGFNRGKGAITTESGALSQSQYFADSHARRTGTNPYELIAAAHAACFSVALAHELAGSGVCPNRINTRATVTMEQLSVDWTITSIQLDVLAEVPRAEQCDFIRAALNAKTNCAISRLIRRSLEWTRRS